MHKKINFHCHSFYSDGNMDLKHILLHAFASNYSTISITDHYDHLKERGKFEAYLKAINQAKKSIDSKQLTFLRGVEVPMKVFEPFTKERKKYKQLDFILFEDLEDIHLLSKCAAFAQNETIPIGIAHLPIHQFNSTKELAAIFSQSNLFIELNQGYFNRKYTNQNDYNQNLKRFIALFNSTPNKLSVGTDSHVEETLSTVTTEKFVQLIETKWGAERLIFSEQIQKLDVKPKNQLFDEPVEINEDFTLNDITHAFSKAFTHFGKGYISQEEKAVWFVLNHFNKYNKIPPKIRKELENFDTHSNAWRNFIVWKNALIYSQTTDAANKRILEEGIRLMKSKQSFLGHKVGAALLFSAVIRNNPTHSTQAQKYLNQLKSIPDASLQKNIQRLQGKGKIV